LCGEGVPQAVRRVAGCGARLPQVPLHQHEDMRRPDERLPPSGWE
jgi:hypothetical protein